jgi:hypothetical protein
LPSSKIRFTFSIPLPILQSDINITSLPLFVIAMSFSKVLHGPSLYVDMFSVFTFIALILRFSGLLSVPNIPDGQVK